MRALSDTAFPNYGLNPVEIDNMNYFLAASVILHLLILFFGVSQGLGIVCDYLSRIEERLEAMEDHITQ